MYAVDQEVTVWFVDEVDDEDITIFEELPTEQWYIGAFLHEYMPESTRALIEQQEFQPAPKSVWAWRVFTAALVAACVWLSLR